MKFGKPSQTVEGFCFVTAITSANRPNNGKDDDDGEEEDDRRLQSSSKYCSL
jgi:hypothetical protein